MDYQDATLNGIPGRGYALVIGEHARRRRCDGVFVSTSPDVADRFVRGLGQRGRFAGVLYERGQPRRRAFDVQITGMHSHDGETVVRFLAFHRVGPEALPLDRAPSGGDASRRSAA